MSLFSSLPSVGDEAKKVGAKVLENGGTPVDAAKAIFDYSIPLLPVSSVVQLAATVVGTCPRELTLLLFVVF